MMSKHAKKFFASAAVVAFGLVGLTACSTDSVATTCQKFSNIGAKVNDAVESINTDPERTAGNLESALSEYSKMMHATEDSEFEAALGEYERYIETIYETAQSEYPGDVLMENINALAEDEALMAAIDTINNTCGG